MYVDTHVDIIMYNTCTCTCIYFEPSKELEMLQYSESVKEDIVLGTDAEALSDLVHVGPDVITIDDCCTRRGCVQT